ncbi:hypothetical protein DOTSEDRAFT_72630 [Dothistroma septosporum NZE10]|uniref:Ca3427-like PBP 2 domain-containing protein n=1 Tax=Dothistroma septosporum (strain NZE10 / CBS 128990) TaxID=675120 RepID=M2YMT0_DOTSN|nr:hypothetical protein DOTSEDRAFT_72630 [Dothistroma septosporum NZE10]
MFARPSLRTASTAHRSFSSSATMAQRLRIGYVPEHFSTPLAFAQKHYDLNAELIPFPTGTGALAGAVKASASDPGSPPIDIAIGLTEGFVSDLGKTKSAGLDRRYGLVGTYVESPLCWAISTGASRSDVTAVGDLKGKAVGVSRIGSGSYVMSYVLADQHEWLASPNSGGTSDPFKVEVIGDFAALRKSVEVDKSSDFFMWEHFTTKHYWDSGELKRIGEIYTPWPSWVIAARHDVDGVEEVLQKLNQGVKHYLENKQEAVEYITGTMKYSKEDVLEWMKTVTFAEDVRGVRPSMIDETVGLLRKAGVLKGDAGESEHMVSVERSD